MLCCRKVTIRQHLDPLVREEYTVRLKNLRQPLPIYYKCFRAIEDAIKAGYSANTILAYPVALPLSALWLYVRGCISMVPIITMIF